MYMGGDSVFKPITYSSSRCGWLGGLFGSNLNMASMKSSCEKRAENTKYKIFVCLFCRCIVNFVFCFVCFYFLI